MARPHIRLELPAHDREILRSWLRASKTKRSLAERAELILLCGQGFTATQVSEKLSKRLRTVQEWRRATCSRDCQDWRINLAQAAPQSCRRPVRAILTATVQRIPCESTFWSVRLGRARRSELPSGHSDLEGGRSETASHPQLQDQPRPHFAEKVIDVVGLYPLL